MSTCGRIVMIPIEKSSYSKRIVEWYFNKLWKYDDQVIFIHVYNIPLMSTPTARFGYSVALPEWEGVHKSVDKEVLERISEFEELCSSRNLRFKTIYKTGEAGIVICEQANKENVNFIIMGSRGLGKIARVLIGSVSRHVILHSGLPVLVIPPRTEEN
ncbi:universal stress protein Slr1101-like isoform X1 [Xenia sp. Carnegie-2017]|uniref:universal stress protein Slr1101-like isoform X1 n=1 Tax=Xenia sp. Carnegie-2017 TaxID=2897299 RepID=UPI001F0382DD|nr:universal stress protein Slr1101-like isoform X1 [Xenia sp. Carnegie-2017]